MPAPQTPKNYYRILGLSRDATRDDIKQAYRELAREWHPDVNSSADAAKRFREIAEAYNVLNDAGARRTYDQQTASANPETSISTAGRMKKFLREGGTPTNKMLLEALRDNGDAETVKVLLAVGVVPDEKSLSYAVQNLSAYLVDTLIRAGGTPTPAMLQDTVTHNRPHIARILLDSGVPSTAAAERLAAEAKSSGWDGQKSLWEEALSSAFAQSVKSTGTSILRGFFSGPKPPQP